MEPGEQVRKATPVPALAEAETLATRASLLGRLKDFDNQPSWQEFFNTYWRLVYSTALKAGLTPEESQDAVQETFVAVAKNIGGFRYEPAKCSFKSWLLLITRQRIIWQLRKRPPAAALRARSTEDADQTPTVERIPDEASLHLDAHWEAEWENTLMAAALETVKRQVKPRQFQIFDLAALQNWPVRDIARMLKVSAAQVYLARHRVGSLLKKELRRLANKESAPVRDLNDPGHRPEREAGRNE
jgi:RNA polymerase sigma-70 factor (ECF subfamily)